MKKRLFIVPLLLLPVLAGLAGCSLQEPEESSAGETILEVGLPGEVKTSLSESLNGKRKVYWADGDQISLNGVASDALSNVPAGQSSMPFRVEGTFALPYDILYPASWYKDAATVTLPAVQTYTAGSVTVPMACRVTETGGDILLKHLCTVIRLAVVGSGQLASVSFNGNAGEGVCGDFGIDYQSATLGVTDPADADLQQTVLTVGQALSDTTPLELFITVPSREYASGFTIILTNESGEKMKLVRSSGITLEKGKIMVPAQITYSPGDKAVELELPGLEMDVLITKSYNVQGRVVDTSDNPVEGVVVTDGVNCVKTLFDGSFYMQSDLSSAKFIYISTPAGYLPPVSSGVPQFYKTVASLSKSGGVLQCGDFVLTPVENPDNCTLIFTADPQPRSSSINIDNVAYRSLVCCEDMYKELKETAAAISGRQVYGICLGDIVHESMSLFSNYVTGLGTLGYPTFNVMGNHDNNPNAADDAAGAENYESWFGPRNYSFNIGKMHFVVLDDICMYKGTDGTLRSYDNGLDDVAWNFLQADLALVPKSTTLMVCAHGPMFRKSTGAEISTREATIHGEDYDKLLRGYSKVHAWAGHTHATYNYVYPSSHRLKNVEVHTLSRSTGELWTNEYLSAGTPRGFTIVEVRNGVIDSWRFHPTKYQSGAFHGSSLPSLTRRDWNYVSGVAKMKSGGATLSEAYQMHIYPPGSYASGDGYLYVNVFLWDSKWDAPKFVSGGTTKTMELVTDDSRHDLADTEMRTFYYNNSALLRSCGYTAQDTGYPSTLFRVAASASGSGTVKVTDRFDNEYSQSISW